MVTRDVDNNQDLLDSRDVVARIKELEDEREDIETDEDATEGERADALAEWDDEYGAELKALKALEDEASASPDWKYGESLIRDSYFKEYAQELAEDIGAIDKNASWPNTYIDWDAAADALKQDYMSVEFDGVTYWIHA